MYLLLCSRYRMQKISSWSTEDHDFMLGRRWATEASICTRSFKPQSTYICRVHSSVWRLPKHWPPTPSPPSECVLPPPQRQGGRRVHYTLAERRGGGSIFWKTPDIGLASYSLIPLRFKPSVLIQPNAYDYTVQLKLSVKNKPACTSTYDNKQLQKAGGNTSLGDIENKLLYGKQRPAQNPEHIRSANSAQYATFRHSNKDFNDRSFVYHLWSTTGTIYVYCIELKEAVQ